MYLMRFIPQSSIIVTIHLLLNLGCCLLFCKNQLCYGGEGQNLKKIICFSSSLSTHKQASVENLYCIFIKKKLNFWISRNLIVFKYRYRIVF